MDTKKGKKMRVKVFTKAALVRENERAIQAERNMTLVPKRLEVLTNDDEFYPVSLSMLHNDDEVRCTIVLDADGNTGMLDVSIGVFNNLPEMEATV